MTSARRPSPGVWLRVPLHHGEAELLSQEALEFLAFLQRSFRQRRASLLNERQVRQALYDQGVVPDFLPETADVRTSPWTVATLPHDLRHRRVSIIGPPGRKLLINAMNSGASSVIPDLEDSLAPTWTNVIAAHANLRDAVTGSLRYTGADGRIYEPLRTPPFEVRPRGWHLIEKHLLIDGEPVAAALFDFGLYAFHNARPLMAHNSGPYFFLPKLESRNEARLWNDVFIAAQDYLDLPTGTFRALVIIETLPAAFEIEEILYELRDHASGVCCGGWDYIFSFIKVLKHHRHYVFPDRSDMINSRPLRACAQHIAAACHQHGTAAIGGVSAFTPLREDADVRTHAFEQVRREKQQEIRYGFDGAIVAHPDLVRLVRSQFEATAPPRVPAMRVTRDDLLECPSGTITELGLRSNIRVVLKYLTSWLSGNGSIVVDNLMEGAARAEISRALVWHWVHRPEVRLDTGRPVSLEMVRKIAVDELRMLTDCLDAGGWATAMRAGLLIDDMTSDNRFCDSLIACAYRYL